VGIYRNPLVEGESREWGYIVVDYDISPLEILLLLLVNYDSSLLSSFAFFCQWITIYPHSRDSPSTIGLRYFSENLESGDIS
jgi:hypothetical protein